MAPAARVASLLTCLSLDCLPASGSLASRLRYATEAQWLTVAGRNSSAASHCIHASHVSCCLGCAKTPQREVNRRHKMGSSQVSSYHGLTSADTAVHAANSSSATCRSSRRCVRHLMKWGFMGQRVARCTCCRRERPLRRVTVQTRRRCCTVLSLLFPDPA